MFQIKVSGLYFKMEQNGVNKTLRRRVVNNSDHRNQMSSSEGTKLPFTFSRRLAMRRESCVMQLHIQKVQMSQA